jgi:uncharacterized protein YraI
MEDALNFAIKTFAAGVAAAVLLPAAASAQNAEVSATVNMRAGPGTQYPVVTTIPEGRDVSVAGCVRGYDWCDTTWRGRRGWVFGDYIDYEYDNRLVPVPEFGARLGLPILSFSFGDYADRHYRNEPWFRDRDRWEHGGRHDGRWDHDRDRRDHDRDRAGRDRNDGCPAWRDECGPRERSDRDRRDHRDRDRGHADRGRGDHDGRQADDNRGCPPWRDDCGADGRNHRDHNRADDGNGRGDRRMDQGRFENGRRDDDQS